MEYYKKDGNDWIAYKAQSHREIDEANSQKLINRSWMEGKIKLDVYGEGEISFEEYKDIRDERIKKRTRENEC
jgi:hypothetical protein